MKCRGNYPVFSDDAHSLGAVGNVGILVDADKNPGLNTQEHKEGNFRLWMND